MMKFPVFILSLFLAVNTVFTSNAQSKLIFEQDFKKNQLQKKWLTVNGSWEIKDAELHASKDINWAILLANKPLPEDYILTFSAIAEPKTYLFEVMLNLNGSKFLGILLNQLENRVAIEDRSLFANLENRGSFIHSSGHIGTMPKVKRTTQHDWQDWKIQRSGNQFFIWINQEAVISFKDSTGFVKPKGQFGFAFNGKGAIKNLKLWKLKGESALPPQNFKNLPLIKPFFVFE
ncbi:hypothetical protein [Pedobacter gandavensis]|uniref:DUF1080 domain-containing protein n=1 Tax=Pedobacter gandavensis TaxID=2679963 RepID=A0ABR6F0S1_9SPHI|nr:hypothetical protein [Pedobacter gandavensis]MBB2150283.1 hypothetical protein [Pedobacter gandavensis]